MPERKSGKLRRVPVNVSVCLFIDVISDTEYHFRFRAVGCGFEDV